MIFYRENFYGEKTLPLNMSLFWDHGPLNVIPIWFSLITINHESFILYQIIGTKVLQCHQVESNEVLFSLIPIFKVSPTFNLLKS